MGTQTCWYLVNKAGVQHKLPQTMIFLGREECDIVLQSRSVDKRHAVITYDHFENKFKVKDLSSLNGTFVNETRILEQTYVKLEHGDTVRFGYDPTAYRIEKVEEVTVTLEKKLAPWSQETSNKEFSEDFSTSLDKPSNYQQGMECSDRPFSTVTASATSAMHPSTDYYGYCQTYPLAASSSFTSVDCYGIPQIPHISHSSIIYTHSRDSRSPTPSGLYSYSTNQIPSPPSAPSGYVYTVPYSQTIPASGDVHRSCTTPPTNFSVPYNPQPQTNVATVYQVSASGYNQGIQGTIPLPHSYSPPQAPTPSTQSLTTVMTPIATTNNECIINVVNTASSSISLSSNKCVKISPSFDNYRNNNNVNSTNNNNSNTSSKQDLTKNKESEVVKRGTPLYGQPTWWGDDQEDQYSYPHTATLRSNEPNNNKTDFENHQIPERPSTLYITKQEYKGKIGEENKKLNVPPKNCEGENFKKENSPPEQDSIPAKPHGATAFTIDLEDDKPTKLGIHDSLSRFVPPTKLERDSNRESFRHKKLMAKFDESSKVLMDLPSEKRKKGSAEDEHLGKKLEDVLRFDNGTKPLIRSSSTRKTGGYFSEGYNSPSDPEEDISIRSDHQVVKKIRSSEKDAKKKEIIDQQIERYREEQHLLHQQHKNSMSPKNGLHNVTPIIKSKGMTGAQLNDSAFYLIDKMFASSENTPPVPPARSSKLNKTSPVLELKPEHEDGTKDNVSESGTYTIDETAEVEEARKNIDQVFGITNEESVTSTCVNEMKSNTVEKDIDSERECSPRRKLPDPQEINEEEKKNNGHVSHRRSNQLSTIIDASKTKEINIGQNSILSSGFNKEMASEKPIINPVIKGAMQSESSRPRRKLPSLPFSSGTGATPSPKGSDVSDTESLSRHSVSGIKSESDIKSINSSSILENSLDNLQRNRRSSFDLTQNIQICERTPVINGMNKNSQKSGLIEKLKQDSLQTRSRRSFPLMNWKNENINKSALASLTKPRQEISNSDLEDYHVSEIADNESVLSDVSSNTDVSESGFRSKNKNEKPPQLRFNRAFSLRRKQLGLEDGDSTEKLKTANSGTKSGSITDLSQRSLSSTTASNFSRGDGGRFSLRMSKNPASPFTRRDGTKADEMQRTRITASSSAHTISSRSGCIRNNSFQNKNAIQAKEHELSRWMRRKEYDPMKAAAEGRRKTSSKPSSGTNGNGMLLTRSPSFHGTGDLTHHGIRHNTFSSDDDSFLTGEEELKTESKHSAQIAKVGSEVANDLALLSKKEDLERSSSYTKINNSAKKEIPDDSYEMRPSSTRSESSFHLSGTSLTSLPLALQQHDEIELRRKQKIEAMDNLVISTIHQLSHKVRDNLDDVLMKLGDQCKNLEQTSPIDELLGHIQDKELPAWKTTSRELATILRNLRRVDQSLEVLKSALFVNVHSASTPTVVSTPPPLPPRASLSSHSYHARTRQLKEEIVYHL